MAKKVAFYGVTAAVCLVFSYVETLLPLSFIAPGIKIGLANGVALLLILKKDIKGAFLVNIIRIILLNLLFVSPFALVFSLTAGLLSTCVMWLASKIGKFGVIGFSVLGALTHNIVQVAVALIFFGTGVLFYLPVLIFSAIISGAIIGFLAKILDNKIKTFF
ncbi:MAG: Gx transporter family protein [Ruminococcaceae bacterium]|nr:Gx transporter family protein [Oscillospiraceae bacterium]